MAAAGEEDGEADAIATKKQESTLPTIVVEFCNFYLLLHSGMVLNALGLERRNSIMASIYLLHSVRIYYFFPSCSNFQNNRFVVQDVADGVRQMAWRVWKGCIAHTPRMLNEVFSFFPHRAQTVLINRACFLFQ